MFTKCEEASTRYIVTITASTTILQKNDTSNVPILSRPMNLEHPQSFVSHHIDASRLSSPAASAEPISACLLSAEGRDHFAVEYCTVTMELCQKVADFGRRMKLFHYHGHSDLVERDRQLVAYRKTRMCWSLFVGKIPALAV